MVSKMFLKLFEWMMCGFVMGALWGKGFHSMAIIMFFIALSMIIEWSGLINDKKSMIMPGWLKFAEGLLCAFIGLVFIGSANYVLAGIIILVAMLLVAESHSRFRSAWY